MSSSGVAWTDAHTHELYRAMTRIILASRSQLYAHPGLADVHGHGGDKINKKTQAALRTLATGLGIQNGAEIVKVEMDEALKGGKNRVATPSPKKEKVGAVKPGQKRKSEGDAEQVLTATWTTELLHMRITVVLYGLSR